jgi:hypothetical protein
MEAAVGVTEHSSAAPAQTRPPAPSPAVARTAQRVVLTLVSLLVSPAPGAGVLPDDRADALYHSYDGGGVEVTGPSYLVRKGDNKALSGEINYYVDNISSASIDVLTQGSAYSEQRTQWSGSLDYLHADTSMNASYTYSSESDYKADTYSFSITQSLFGDLSNLTIGYSRGYDDVLDNFNPSFRETADHTTSRCHRC